MTRNDSYLDVEEDYQQAQPLYKPTISSDIDGNVFAVMGTARRALMRSGMNADAKRMIERVTQSGSYDAALAVICEYVDFDDEETS